ncbi:tRNA-specific adenosine deaminase subunit tad3 [Marasmius crinis-equi]|uniref:tRNA-specific adenosine deaminase subunit tad3 n=1 Tax=Marasmius crinis-equi TaxID=585013 RepID=A0ABR3FZM5_9AGAR
MSDQDPQFKAGHKVPVSDQQLPGLQSEMAGPPPQSEYVPTWDGGYKLYEASGKLKGKKALITGGDSGIGRAIAILFAMEGADVFITYLPQEKEDAQDTKAFVEKYGRKCDLLAVDLIKKENCKQAVDEALKAMGAINFLINNHAYQMMREDIQELSEEQWEHTFNTNIHSFFYLSKYTIPHMKRGDSIINNASINAYIGRPDLLDYTSTKGAVIAFTRGLSNQYVSKGIRVNAVAPGPVWTPLIPSTMNKEAQEQFTAPMGRPIQPSEVATCFVFLASMDSTAISGQTLHPNGGTVVAAPDATFRYRQAREEGSLVGIPGVITGTKKLKSHSASQPIPSGTIIEISPVLFFSKEEYEQHGKHTVLDHYTFKWKDGRMALALGLGSLFNHSDSPNVSYTLDSTTESISYRTVRDIENKEELLIFYGHNLWFEQADSQSSTTQCPPPEVEDGWGGLSLVNGELEDDTEDPRNPYLDGNPDEIIEEEMLPFVRIKPLPEEETLDSIRTVPAWVVEIPDPRHITTLLKWLKKTGLNDPELGHLKRIRKQDDKTTLLLSISPVPPLLPDDLHLPELCQVPVPISPALTMTSLALKSTFWPTYYTPRRKGESESWTRAKCKWAWEAMRNTIEEGRRALSAGELPIGAHVPVPFNEHGSSFNGHDTRNSAQHPLRHAVLNLVRHLGDSHSAGKTSPDEEGSNKNGSNYLLTSRTIFLTHEPCIMCSMALLHSRVKEVFYLIPMKSTGGCGGVACLPTLQGVNHRFEICRWTSDVQTEHLTINEDIDA